MVLRCLCQHSHFLGLRAPQLRCVCPAGVSPGMQSLCAASRLQMPDQGPNSSAASLHSSRLVASAGNHELGAFSTRVVGAIQKAASLGEGVRTATQAEMRQNGGSPPELRQAGEQAHEAETQRQISAAEEDDLAQSSARPATVAAVAAAQASQQLNKVGAFQKIPIVQPAEEHLSSALKRANRTPTNQKIKNEAARAKNRAARALDGLTKDLAIPLGQYCKGFPSLPRLHPFERALLTLTLGNDAYAACIAKVDNLRKAVLEVGKAYAGRAAKAGSKKAALELQEEGFDAIAAVFRRGGACVDALKDTARQLRRLPVVEPYLPMVALVGAPNVGKSSLVQVLSSGEPEVCDYPFTTRTLKLGHFYVNGRRHQVTDTPGLLNRAEEERNAMERLTLASLQHLPTAVLFVTDLTGGCGTSLPDQWTIRHDLRERYPAKPWLDILSKQDLLEEEFDEADRLASEGEAGPAGGPVRLAMDLPAALRVSSTTKAGMTQLQAAVMEMLAAAQFEEALLLADDHSVNDVAASELHMSDSIKGPVEPLWAQ